MKKAFLFAALVLFAAAGFSQSQKYVSDEDMAVLQKDGSIIKWQIDENKDFVFGHTPDTELCKKSAVSWTKEYNPVFSTENLYLISKETLKNNAADKNNVDFSMEHVSQIIRSVSKMKGMQYFSRSDKKWETLYHHANMVAGPKDKTVIPDNLEGSAEGFSAYCILDDNTFGESVYQLNYSQHENEVSVRFTNIDPLKLAFISGVKKEDMIINLTVIENQDSYLIYMTCQAKYPSVGFLEKRLKNSFDARIDAIFNWFTYQF